MELERGLMTWQKQLQEEKNGLFSNVLFNIYEYLIYNNV